jgi:hypothetical protein
MAEHKNFLSSVYKTTGSSYMDSKIREHLEKQQGDIAAYVKQAEENLDRKMSEGRDSKGGKNKNTTIVENPAARKDAVYPNSTPGIFKEEKKSDAPRFGHSLILSQSPKFKAFTEATVVNKDEHNSEHVVELFLNNIAKTSLSTSEKNTLARKLGAIRETIERYTHYEDNATIILETKTLLEITLPTLNESFYNLSSAGALKAHHFEQLNSSLHDIQSYLDAIENNATSQLDDAFSKAILFTQKRYKQSL